jgi:hypothetical protein
LAKDIRVRHISRKVSETWAPIVVFGGDCDTDRDGKRSRPSALQQVYKDESVYE